MQSLFPNNKVLLDGGFGTTLESTFGLNISNTPLWSAKAVVERPDVIVQAHLAFLHAGSDIILTSTYQCSYATFERAGYGIEEAKKIFIKSIELAIQARDLFYEENDTHGRQSRNIRIALSLGSFGASLVPAQEFDGFYPPPFGPKGYASTGNNYNSFEDDDQGRELERQAIGALTDFHLQRLLILLEERRLWNMVDCIAFETVPVLREIRAIRKAMDILTERIASEGLESKPWWISMVFPDGKFPQVQKDNSMTSVRDVVKTVLERGGGNVSTAPPALGVNCTSIEYIPMLILEMGKAVNEIRGTSEKGCGKPWLVVYPNGGDVYDPVTQTWKVADGDKENKKDVWAKTLAELTSSEGYPWGGYIVGGCCRTGPEHIQVLRQTVKD
ncbi:Homocysteine S-methyltransferase [Dendrothele bispora CBS 962.96]|uniref:Homocysteine S-methyltransferase n=1 Tax=Dendrothele bispora (strain CBS 962.96) TaxID=1314807 RepID=A0A4S8M0F2_DENBC|nr:Homocysteine S-methyltransferase [Dendrothele bispora CBS 962.96]